MYDFVSGPLVWIAFIVFVAGMVYQFVRLLTLAKKDKVIYPYMSLRVRIPISFPLDHSLCVQEHEEPVRGHDHDLYLSSLSGSCAHISRCSRCHVLVFMGAEVGDSLGSAATVMTILVILGAIFFLVRRLMMPEVRFVTFPSDYVLLAIAAAPFVTGFMANRQWFDYETMVLIHMISGAVMLMAIPFTRLSHMLFFPFTRAYMGSEFGAVRHAKDW